MIGLIIGIIFALPYEILFFTIWTLSSIFRPLLLLTIVCIISNPYAGIRKIQLFILSIQYLLLCNDKKFKLPITDPIQYFPDTKKHDDNDNNENNIQRKTIIFIRHGESTWNDTFNKGDRSKINFILYFIPNLIYATCMEYYFFLTGQDTESWFYDSPLSQKGKQQAMSIHKYLQQDMTYLTPKEIKLVKYLKGINIGNNDDNSSLSTSSQIVSSNLRRSIATVAIGLQDRFQKNDKNDKMLIIPALQEISRNPDALSITPPYKQIIPAWTDPYILRTIYSNHIDTSKHSGNKPVNTNGLKRLQEFCNIVFNDIIDKDCIIVGGHSLWFRSFFKTYLPRDNTHVCKTKKIVNGGIVGFTLQQIKLSTNENKYEYMIDPTSIVVLHGGF